MERKLKLDKPLVFENRTLFFTPASLALIFIIISVSPLVFFPITENAAVISLVLAGFCFSVGLYLWNSISGILILDCDGIEVKTRFGAKRLPWSEVSFRSSKTFYSYTTYYIHSSNNKKLSFGEAIQDTPYALEIIDSVINLRPGASGWLTVPPPPAVTTYPGGPITTVYALATGFLIYGLLMLHANYDDYVNLFTVPAIGMSEAKEYADKPQCVQLTGSLRSEDVVQSRDGQEQYALQVAIFTYGNSEKEKSLYAWVPAFTWISGQGARVKIICDDPKTDYLDEIESVTLGKDWKTSPKINPKIKLISEAFDDQINKLVKKHGSVKLVLTGVRQNASVVAVGHLVHSGDHLLLRPPQEQTCLYVHSANDIKTTATKDLAMAATAIGWAILGIASGILQTLAYLRKGRIDW